MPKRIALTRGKFAVVSDEDFSWINSMKWRAMQCKPGRFYAVHSFRQDGKIKSIYMHRLITAAPKGQEVDHVNGDPLDNRRENLRFCTRSQNIVNKPKKRGCTSRHPGVHWDKRNKRWHATANVNGSKLWGGCFKDEGEAATAADELRRKHYGGFVPELATVTTKGGEE